MYNTPVTGFNGAPERVKMVMSCLPERIGARRSSVATSARCQSLIVRIRAWPGDVKRCRIYKDGLRTPCSTCDCDLDHCAGFQECFDLTAFLLLRNLLPRASLLVPHQPPHVRSHRPGNDGIGPNTDKRELHLPGISAQSVHAMCGVGVFCTLEARSSVSCLKLGWHHGTSGVSNGL